MKRHQTGGVRTQDGDLGLRGRGKLLKKDIEVHCFKLAPAPPPGDELGVLGFEIQKSGTRTPEDTRRGPLCLLRVRHAQVGHNGIPLPTVSMQGTWEKLVIQRQVSVPGLKKLKGQLVVKAGMLAASKSRRLRVANMNVGSAISRNSVSRKNQITTVQGNELGMVQHAYKSYKGHGDPTTPTPK